MLNVATGIADQRGQSIELRPPTSGFAIYLPSGALGELWLDAAWIDQSRLLIAQSQATVRINYQTAFPLHMRLQPAPFCLSRRFFFKDYFAIWGSGPNDVWTVGDGIQRWDGTAWSVYPNMNTTPRSIWGSGPNDVWAVGTQGILGAKGIILHWDGSTWSHVASTTAIYPSSVGGTGPNDVWVADGSNFLHWNGSTWTTVKSETTASFFRIWGSGPNDVWAVGTSGTILHWNGNAWSNVPSGTSVDLSSVWGSGPNDVWTLGRHSILHWNGIDWTPAYSGENYRQVRQPLINAYLSSIWGSGPNDVWAVGDFGIILHWDGSTWSTFTSGSGKQLGGVWGSGPNDVWFLEEASIFHNHCDSSP